MTFMCLQVNRILRYMAELGPGRVLFSLVLIAVGAKAGFDFFIKGNAFVVLIAVPIMLSIQTTRKDRNFLSVVGLSGIRLYAFLNFMVALPFAILLIAHQEWVYLGVILVAATAIPLLKPRSFDLDALFVNVGGFLPYRYFEWRTGLRQYGLAVIILVVIGLCLGFYTATVPLVIAFLTLNTSVFYLQGEAKELLIPFGQTPRQVMGQKIAGHLKLFGILTLPLATMFLVFNSEYWFILLYALVISLIVNVNTIIFKYASYEPGAKLDNNQTLQILSFGAFLIPFLFPIPIVLSVMNYRKAIKNLEPYLS